ncbi:MAG: NAD(P)H-hydrate dehydratase [Candidatus Malihini olakiniferum]
MIAYLRWYTLVLKNVETVIADKADVLSLADIGNLSMAIWSISDVLSGIISALLLQKLSPAQADCARCMVHGPMHCLSSVAREGG